MKVQELSFKDNNYHVYQTQVSSTIISKLSKIQDYSEVKTIVTVMPHYSLDVN